MPKVTPFKAIRPTEQNAKDFCALPYDVYNRAEAKEIVLKNPMSFLAIDRAETSFDDSVGTYDECVYAKALELLNARITDGTLIQDEKPCFYVYELTMDGRSQSGIVACSSVEDYVNSTIKKHENTREDKEIDRINHVDKTNAHTGPIFLIYRSVKELKDIVAATKADSSSLLYDFIHEDGIRHRAFIINKEETVSRIKELFADIPCTYIADGHHRCASAVKVGLRRREEKGTNADAGYERFLSVIFPDDELMIMPYNRVVKDIAGMNADEFLNAVRAAGFDISDASSQVSPSKKGEFGMFLDDKWYVLRAKEEIMSEDPVKGLDVSVLQDNLLGPILKIEDPRTDKRIDFVGGIRGLAELEKRCHSDMKLAFSMYPTSIQELLDVADAGLLMPPKSTWFEPKLLSGMFIHSLDD